MRGLIQEMGGNYQDLSSTPPTMRRSEGEGIRGEAQGGSRFRESAPNPLGERRMPKEQDRDIVAWIINFLPGGSLHSGQTPATQTQQARQN